jgi:phosphate starvation-inducible PhoH-like protein
MTDQVFETEDRALYQKICGFKDQNLKSIEEAISIRLTPRGTSIIISGSQEHAEIAEKLLHVMSDFLADKPENYEFDRFDIKYLITLAKSGEKINFAAINRLKIFIPESKKNVYPKSFNQIHYLSEIDKKAITFAIGPAGTGKTYLAVAAALKEYYNGKVRRIILTRPAVEAGENLGFLPGDLVQKINPYLRPLYDALFDLVSFEKIDAMMEKNIIEIAPLAYMRGRTLNDAFIILDEAQNTTASQMKMFLTRLGNNSKMVISGDITQIDIDKPKRSGLLLVRKILRKVKDVSFVEFNSEDICRNPVVEQIINAYEEFSGEH